MPGQHSRPDQRHDPLDGAAGFGPAGPGSDAFVPKETPWSIGDGGRAISEVVPVLRDSNEGPDTVADAGVVGSVHMLAASIRGLSHQESGTPRQDAYGFAVTPDQEWLVVVVADGVSAGRLSHRAAQVVARHAPARVLDELAEVGDPRRVDWYRVFKALAGRIVGVGQKLLADEGVADATPQEVAEVMATTATIAVVEISPPDGQRRTAYAWLGDSPAWFLVGNTWDCLTEVKNAGREIASSSVTALPRLPSEADLLPKAFVRIPADATLLVMTDGVGDPLGAGHGEVADVLAEVWRRPPSPFRFVEQVAFGRKSFDDDRTVVAIWPRTGR
jgi:hypothetical protein